MKERSAVIMYNYNRPIKIICLLLLAAWIFSSQAASSLLPNTFGTKVNMNDQDVGHPLHKLCADLRYRDVGYEINEYDLADPVYLDANADGYVDINDIRLTPYSVFPPGSKARKTDVDINASLIRLENWSIACFDLNGNEIYDLNDPLYLHNRSTGYETSEGDIRLTQSWDFSAGSKVKESDKDKGMPVFDLLEILSGENGIAYIRFYNANGNYQNKVPVERIHLRDDSATPIYDSPDQVYIDIGSPEQSDQSGLSIGFVDANDLRLSI